MSGVTFIDAAGIGVLTAAANRAREAGGGLSLLAPSRQVRRLLDILPLEEILPAVSGTGLVWTSELVRQHAIQLHPAAYRMTRRR
jgi:anti-anti-sigma regulatory factor